MFLHVPTRGEHTKISARLKNFYICPCIKKKGFLLNNKENKEFLRTKGPWEKRTKTMRKNEKYCSVLSYRTILTNY